MFPRAAAQISHSRRVISSSG